MNYFSLFADDPLHRLLSNIKLTKQDGMLRTVPAIVFYIILTWIPMAILSQMQGVAIGPTTRTSFLYDFAAYAQLLFAVPIFIIAEQLIDMETKNGIRLFLISGIVPKNQVLILKEKLDFATKLKTLIFPEIAIFILGFICTWIWLLGELTNNVETWHALIHNSEETITWAGLWGGLFSVPIVIYWHFRWLWKIFIWYWVLWQISKLNIVLHASHPDQFGGLKFLTRLQSRFGILIFTDGIVFSATIGYKLLIEKAPFTTIAILGNALMYVIVTPLLFLIPMLFFSSILYQTKRRDLSKYSALSSYFTSKVDNQLRDSKKKKSLNLKDEIDKLSSLNALFQNAQNMRTFPFDFKYSKRLFGSALGPILPLILTAYPIIKNVIAWINHLIQ